MESSVGLLFSNETYWVSCALEDFTPGNMKELVRMTGSDGSGWCLRCQFWTPGCNHCPGVVRVLGGWDGVCSVANRTGSPEIHQWLTGRTSGLHVLQSEHCLQIFTTFRLCQSMMMLNSMYYKHCSLSSADCNMTIMLCLLACLHLGHTRCSQMVVKSTC